MAGKSFPSIEKRDLPVLTGLEAALETRCALLETRLLDLEMHIHVKHWTRSEVRKEIRRITGEEPKHIIKDRKSDPGPHFKGLYVWFGVEEGKVKTQYVGISQNLERRISGHVQAPNRAIATWAHMLNKHAQDTLGQAFTDDRTKMGKYDFSGRPAAQEFIRNNYKCTVLLEPNDYLLYMLEVYAAIRFQSFWNTFQTH